MWDPFTLELHREQRGNNVAPLTTALRDALFFFFQTPRYTTRNSRAIGRFLAVWPADNGPKGDILSLSYSSEICKRPPVPTAIRRRFNQKL